MHQKFEIAEAVLKKPDLLLFDEPTSTLSGRDIDWLRQVIVDTRAGGAPERAEGPRAAISPRGSQMIGRR